MSSSINSCAPEEGGAQPKALHRSCKECRNSINILLNRYINYGDAAYVIASHVMELGKHYHFTKI